MPDDFYRASGQSQKSIMASRNTCATRAVPRTKMKNIPGAGILNENDIEFYSIGALGPAI